VIGRKAQQATTPEKIKEIRISFQKLKTKESRINGNMVWTKAEMLKFIDELQRYFDTTTAMGKLYLESYTKAKRENPNLGMESLSEQIALEQLDDITSIAMEGFFTQFSGLMLIFASLLVYLAGVLIMVQGIILIFTGQFVPGILAFFGGGYVRDLGSRMLSTGDQMVNQDSYETANPYHR
jgi:hypothetical protein